MTRWLLAVSLGCTGPGTSTLGTLGAVEGTQIELGLDGGTSGAALRVQVVAPEGAELALTANPPSGLRWGDPVHTTERIADRQVLTARYPLHTPTGRFTVSEVCVTVDEAEPLCAEPLFLDLGEPPDRSELADIVDPGAIWRPPAWAGFALLGLAISLLALRLAARAAKHAPAPPPPPPEAPHLLALRRWEAIRGDASLSPEAKALALSELFRDYLQGCLSFPAASWSTSQILAHLKGLTAFPADQIAPARRLLRATDRVKYAEARPGADLFDALDADLRGFIDATRPRSMEASP